ncbi:MAG: sialidase family protein [bacterium]|jgi:predicted neuraminidase|nr:sialidase family protein [bacterium]
MRVFLALCLALGAISGSSADHPAVVKAEFIYENASFPSCHASTLVEVQPGLLLAAWFGGTEEGADDVGIWLSRHENKAWSAPVEVARHDGVPCWNPVLFQKPGGETLLFYKAGPSPREWSGLLIHSMDGGKTWSQPELLPAGILGPIKNKPILLDDGSLVCGSSVESWNAWACWMEITTDWGKTWHKTGPIAFPGVARGLIQPTLYLGKDNTLHMVCRSTNTIGAVCAAHSKDGGLSWSEVTKTALPHNNSGLDAVRLASGQIALVYNHTAKGRTPLNLGLSSDDGITWSNVLTLEDQPGEYSYPAVIETSDGMIHTTYTWKRERIKHVIIDPLKIY